MANMLVPRTTLFSSCASLKGWGQRPDGPSGSEVTLVVITVIMTRDLRN